MSQAATIKVISLVVAGIGLLLFLTFATYPVDTKIIALLRRIRSKRKR